MASGIGCFSQSAGERCQQDARQQRQQQQRWRRRIAARPVTVAVGAGAHPTPIGAPPAAVSDRLQRARAAGAAVGIHRLLAVAAGQAAVRLQRTGAGPHADKFSQRP